MERHSWFFSDSRQETCLSRAVLFWHAVVRDWLIAWAPMEGSLQDGPMWVSFSMFPTVSLPLFSIVGDDNISSLSSARSSPFYWNLLSGKILKICQIKSDWLPSREWVWARRRKLNWRHSSIREPEMYELVARVITHWSPSMCRHCPFTWARRAVGQGGPMLLKEVLPYPK